MELSVIIPCHNEAATLSAQLDALASQHWEGEWEVIVVDNDSTDGTASLARGHQGLRSRLSVVVADDGRGAAYARRVGVEHSSAHSLAFCDGDDVVERGWLAAMGSALRSHELVAGDVDVTTINPPSLARSRGIRPAGTRPTFAGITFLGSNNAGMWRSTWNELGGFDESFEGHEDIELSLRAHAIGKSIYVENRAVVHYRYRTGWGPLWRQARHYGRSIPLLARRCEDLGITPPDRFAGVRSWAWLLLNLPRTIDPAVRPRWVWTLGSRLGVVRGAFETRRVFV